MKKTANPMTDKGILFEAFLVAADGTAGQHIGTMTAFAPASTGTRYEKRDEAGNIIAFEMDNMIQTAALTMQYKAGAATPEANELIMLVPSKFHDRNWFGNYQATAEAVPNQGQNAVRTLAVNIERSMNGDYMQTAYPAQPAMIYVESYDADTHTFVFRNVGGASAVYGEDAIILNPDRLVLPAGYALPAAVDAVAGTYTPAATDMAKATSRDVVLEVVTP